MSTTTLIHFLLFLFISQLSATFPPQQIHINYGSTPDQMIFNWLTYDNPIITQSLIRYGEIPEPLYLNLSNIGQSYNFIDGGSLHTHRTIHVVNISNLKPKTLYYYQVGDNIQGWSNILSFYSSNDDITLLNNLPLKFVIYGDIGNYNGQILPFVINEGLNNNIDCILHIGDFAYNFDDDNGTIGDYEMNDLEILSSHIPYMVSHGNHESSYNFSHYTERFRGMPNPSNMIVYSGNGPAPNNWYYSFNLGLVHIIAISTEIYFDYPWMIRDQWLWLNKDLEIANNNRSNAPWIFVHGHRPLYCTSTIARCVNDSNLLRNGVILNGSNNSNSSQPQYGLEELFYNFGVDFWFNGHNHNYERMYDIYQNKSDKYTINMTATTYIVTGAAGSCEDLYGFDMEYSNEWDAYRATQYSYTRFYVYNASHIHLQQVAGNDSLSNPIILDDVWYEQYNHGSFKDRKKIDYHSNPNRNKNYNNNNNDYQNQGKSIKSAECPIQESYSADYIDKHQTDTFYIPYLGDDKENYRGLPNVFF